MKVNTIAFENKARRIIENHFASRGLSTEDIRKSVYLPQNDPGEWSPDSLLIVNHEHGVRGPMDVEVDMYQTWQDIDEELTTAIGKPVFFEPINSAVSALYWG